jgi:RHS repeat-associated protein
MTAVNHKDIQNIEWTLSGKMKRITYKPTSSLTSIANIDYNYDPSGNKVAKTVTYRNGDNTQTYFIHDATGNTMATYEASNTKTLALDDQSIYGSSRVGVVNTTGRNYELTDHLGNVRTTLTAQGTIASANDYLPFGKLARSFHPEKYDFSFNGKLKDEETGWQDYGMRDYMSDEIIFNSVDPLTSKFAYLTPYQFASNTPIEAIDLDGKEAYFVHGTLHDADAWTNPTNKNNKPRTNEVLNHQLNDEADRQEAAQNLAAYVIVYRKINKVPDTEEITLIGYSHGGNVAILASQLIEKELGLKVNIITVNTPSYNDKNDNENPINSFSINDMIAIWTKKDHVAGGIAPGSSDHPKENSKKNGETPIEIVKVKSRNKQNGAFNNHFLENVDPKQIKEKSTKKLEKVQTAKKKVN